MSAFSRVEFGVVARTRPGRTDCGSAVAAAAYNAAARYEHDGRTYNFRRKQGEHVSGRVLLPPGAPPEYRDARTLWSAAEAAEKRCDAQTARQVLLSIPRDVPREHWQAFAEAIAEPWVADGAAVQVDVHAPLATDGETQPHAHYLISLRRVSDEGLARTKAREWNVQFQEDKGRAERRRIEERANAWLDARGIAARLDLRSRADRGDDTPPEPTINREEWSRWKRDGGAADQAPLDVRTVLEHRRIRRDLERAQRAADLAATEAEELEAEAARRRADRLVVRPGVPQTDITRRPGHVAWTSTTTERGHTIWSTTRGSVLVDAGDALSHHGELSRDVARDLLDLAARRGWTAIRASGSAAYRDEIAIAAALRRPPITTDHQLSPRGQARLAAALRARDAAIAARTPAPPSTPESARQAAVRIAVGHEQRATSPEQRAEARRVTAAAIASDPAVIAALRAGDLHTARAAAGQWERDQAAGRVRSPTGPTPIAPTLRPR